MTKEITYWQDNHIKEVDGKFICYDESGMSIMATTTIEEAREQLDLYSIYTLNNITD